MPRWRPSTCTPEVVEKAWDYIDNFEEYGHAVPSTAGLCKIIDRARSTVYGWANEDPPRENFDQILDAINENQELVTFNRSLRGEYNSNIAKLLLGKHGYSDKHEADIKTTQDIVIEIVQPDGL